MSQRLVAIGLAAIAAACRSQSSSVPAPTAPTSAETAANPEATAGRYSISGTVVERTLQGTRAVPEAALNLWVDAGTYGYSYWWANGPAYSDAAGNFHLTNLIAATGWLLAYKEGYTQQCALPPISLSTNAANLQPVLVTRDNAWIDVSSVPTSITGRVVAGRILENTAAGTQPVAGAHVHFHPVPEVPAAATYSDGNGRYLLCGLSEGRITVDFDDRFANTPMPRPNVVSNYDILLP